jgi:hypothetical protein
MAYNATGGVDQNTIEVEKDSITFQQSHLAPSFPNLSQTSEWKHPASPAESSSRHPRDSFPAVAVRPGSPLREIPRAPFDKLRVLATARNTATFRNRQVAKPYTII